MKRFAGLVSCAAAAAWMAGCSEQTMAERGLKKLEEGARMEKPEKWALESQLKKGNVKYIKRYNAAIVKHPDVQKPVILQIPKDE